MPTPASDNEFPKLLLVEAAARAAPATGRNILFAKADGLLYWKDDAGNEYAAGGGGLALDDLADVDAPTPADGEVLTWIDANSAWEPATPGASSFDAYGPTAEYRPDRPPASPGSLDDEFDDGSVSGWSAWTGATDPGTDDETTFPGKRLIVASASVSAPTFSQKAFTPASGVAFTFGCKLALAGEAWENHSFQFGLAVMSASTTVIDEIRAVASDGANGQAFMRLYDSISATTRSLNSLAFTRALYLAIGRDTSNNYSAWWSSDGYIFARLNTPAADATAVSHISLAIPTNTTGSDRTVLLEWFRQLAVAPSARMKFGS